ncbi:MAG: 3-isopropylmalate dehydratase small subunit [Verrucomicrobiales bacterium]|nr:3-isopropylmalate dehydratase small subunit [Verrucomicrobiales bacterium]
MALDKITEVSGTGVYVPGSDIDTDRIIPARFMKCVTFDGLGEYLFYDVRHNSDDEEIPHPLNDEKFKGANILLSGINFGCGSSREHAPQAIYRAGFRAVIAQSFAEIFFGNCTTLGIPCVAATGEDIEKIAEAIKADPKIKVTVDVEKCRVFYGEENCTVHIPDSARDALLSARWDPIGELLDAESQIEATASELSYFKS